MIVTADMLSNMTLQRLTPKIKKLDLLHEYVKKAAAVAYAIALTLNGRQVIDALLFLYEATSDSVSERERFPFTSFLTWFMDWRKT